MKQYSTPTLVEFGGVQSLTAADFTNSQTDVIFFNGIAVGQASGSLDACVSEDANAPRVGDCSVTSAP